jgi:hypothetical protein
MLLREGTDDARTRYSNVYALLSAGTSTGDQTEGIATDLVLPFVDKEWKEDVERRGINRSVTYLLVAFAYRERGGDDAELAVRKESEYMDRALEEALLSGNDMQCALCYNFSAYVELKRGDVTRAHEYMYKAIEYYDRQENFTKSSEMLYVIGAQFFEIKDAEGLDRVLEQMREYLDKDDSKQSRYQYNVLKHNYFTLLQERRDEASEASASGGVGAVGASGGANYSGISGGANGAVGGVAGRDGEYFALVDSAMVYIRANVELVERSVDELAGHWMHGYAYYYLAKELDRNYPERGAEIFDALDRAEQITQADMTREGSVVAGEANSHKEFYIMVGSIRLKALFRAGRVAQARRVLDGTMALLDGMENYENLNAIRSEVYRAAVDINEKSGDLGAALRFQKLLTDNEARAHEKEKVRAINDMSAKYDAERGKERIEMLTRENRDARLRLLLAFGLLSVLAVAVVLVVLWGRSRRHNIEQELYETALLAELHQTELDNMRRRESFATRETEIFEAGGEKSDALDSPERLDPPEGLDLPERLDPPGAISERETEGTSERAATAVAGANVRWQSPVVNAVEKIARQVADSRIDDQAKERYRDNLSHLDTALLESAYRLSQAPLTALDMKYIICFNASLDVRDIGLLFNVTPASVNTVRYRIRKKFAKDDPYRIVI